MGEVKTKTWKGSKDLENGGSSRDPSDKSQSDKRTSGSGAEGSTQQLVGSKKKSRTKGK